jgi:hypothetical protein
VTLVELLEPMPLATLTLGLAELQAASVLPTPTARYALACVAAERDRRAAEPGEPVSPSNGIYVNLLGALVKPSAWEWSEPMFACVVGPDLRQLLLRGQCGLPLARIDAIGALGARSLQKARILNAEELLRSAALPDDRAALAAATDLAAGTLANWAHLAEMAVVFERHKLGGLVDPSLDAADAVSLASLATIRSLEDLGACAPPIVADGMKHANDSEHIAPPSSAANLESLVTEWQKWSCDWMKNVGGGRTSMVRDDPPSAAPEPKPCCCPAAADADKPAASIAGA